MLQPQRCFRRRILVLLAMLLAGTLPAANADAAATAKQKSQIAGAGRNITRAGRLYKAKKYRQSGELVKKVQLAVIGLAASSDPAVQRAVATLKKRLEKAHALLELQGVKLPPLEFPKPGEKPASDPAPGKGAVSFSRDVAPLLVAKCGRCHVSDTKGKMSMTSYASLMKGSKSGAVVMPGRGKGSRIIELIVEGDMPRGGGKVASSELAMLTRWIDQGAKCDAPSTETPLSQLAARVARATREANKLEVAQATGKETVSFGGDVAPVLVKTCMNCHGARQPRANFSMASFRRLLDGGDSGPVVVPGKPAESLLIKKLKGTAGDRMPRRLPPLTPGVIAKIETWIAEGARFDGKDAGMAMARVATLHAATHATHEELSLQRAALAKKNWHLAIPDEKPNVIETKNLLVFGTPGRKQLQQIAELAEAQMSKVAAVLKLPAGRPLIKGRLTLYVFARRFDYAEYGQMVEQRGLPRAWRGHWRYDVVDGYVCVVPPRGDDYSLELLLAQQIAGVTIASSGVDVPLWFSEGSARAVAAKLDGRDPRVKSWKERLPQILRTQPSGDAFLAGKLPPEEAHVAAYGFVRSLMKSTRRYQRLLTSLRGGAPFEKAFTKAYGLPPAKLAANWSKRVGR